MTFDFEFDALDRMLPGGDALLILPPFAGIERPSLGLHVLQAVARRAGFVVDIFNANVHFAKYFGEISYTQVCYAPTGDLSGEKIFSALAFDEVEVLCDSKLFEIASAWVTQMSDYLARSKYRVIGCNTMFEQLMCSIALLDRIKKLAPHKTTIIGGAQCEGAMGQGILELGKGIDFVFSGECEAVFVDFLKTLGQCRSNRQRYIGGAPLKEMESLPAADYSSYFEQFVSFFPDSEITKMGLHWLPLEGSRGCWWGQKHHCTFCGINGQGMSYRMKSAEKMFTEIKSNYDMFRVKNLLMVDNIMPHEYFSTLLPSLAEAKMDLRIFYEQKANLTVARMKKISEAGINLIQPGIESLSDGLLTLMGKGVKSWQNIAALRYARMFDTHVKWNILHSLPGDLHEHYAAMEAIIPKLHHLSPPSGYCKLSVDRFSPYFDKADVFGMTNLRPMASYSSIFPPDADLHKLAYHFEADYESDALHDNDCVLRLGALIDAWVASWENGEAPPVLNVSQIDEDVFLLMDTRAVAKRKFRFISKQQAKAALFSAHGRWTRDHEWCVDNNVAVRIGDVIVPLATAKYNCYVALASDQIDDEEQAKLLDYADGAYAHAAVAAAS